MPEQKFYISDGEDLYEVKNMSGVLKQPKDTIKTIYFTTLLSHTFECGMRDNIKSGLMEMVDPTEEYTYPFDAVEATLEEIRDSGVLTTQEIIKMDRDVRTQMGITESKNKNNEG